MWVIILIIALPFCSKSLVAVVSRSRTLVETKAEAFLGRRGHRFFDKRCAKQNWFGFRASSMHTCELRGLNRRCTFQQGKRNWEAYRCSPCQQGAIRDTYRSDPWQQAATVIVVFVTTVVLTTKKSLRYSFRAMAKKRSPWTLRNFRTMDSGSLDLYLCKLFTYKYLIVFFRQRQQNMYPYSKKHMFGSFVFIALDLENIWEIICNFPRHRAEFKLSKSISKRIYSDCTGNHCGLRCPMNSFYPRLVSSGDPHIIGRISEFFVSLVMLCVLGRFKGLIWGIT